MTIDEFKKANAAKLKKSTVAVFRHRTQLQPDGEPRFAIAHKSTAHTMVNAGWVLVDAEVPKMTEPKMEAPKQQEQPTGDEPPIEEI